MTARRPFPSTLRHRLLAGLAPAWLGLALLAGSCLNPSPDELPQADNSSGAGRFAPSAGPADVPAMPGSATAATAPSAPTPSPNLAPAPAAPATETAPPAAGAPAEPVDAGADAGNPDAD